MTTDIALQNNTNENLELAVVENKQQSFLETVLGKAINKAINYGLKKILPDFIEDSVIEIKDAVFKDGIINGINVALNKAVDLGKSAIGTITGTFSKISQIESAVEKGGVIDSASKIIDNQIKNIEKNDILSKDVTAVIKEGKNVIKNDLKQNIKKELGEQKDLLKKVKKYTNEWEKAYNEHNLEKMEKMYDKLVEVTQNTIPIQEISDKVKEIENINNLTQNKNSFEISALELELAKKL